MKQREGQRKRNEAEPLPFARDLPSSNSLLYTDHARIRVVLKTKTTSKSREERINFPDDLT